jgi:hypothetical protein
MHIKQLAALFTMLTPLLLGACSNQPDANSKAQPITASSKTQNMAAPTNQPPPQAGSGTVKSAQVAGAYSYIEADIDGQTHWIATSATRLQPGDRIAWNDYAIMNNFTSKALNRSFGQIMFINQISTPQTQAQATQHANAAHSGVVLDHMFSAGYSYIQVNENGSEIWLAAPQMIIEKGQTISWVGGSTMRNFSSRSLNRTFDRIVFVTSVQKISG